MEPVTPKVTLVQYTSQPESLIASAAKLCYADDPETILQQEHGKAAEFTAMLRNIGHLSPIEHASFTFYLEGVSRAMTHQLVRHRIASYSQRSQRYVGHTDFDYVMPPQLVGKKIQVDGESIDATEYFRQTMEMIADRYRKLNEAMGNTGQQSNQDARYVLPNACETKIFVTMNGRELLHFFQERLCMRAQWEIRRVAEGMLGELKKACPAVFGAAGPKCIRIGRCPEGKLSCGNFKEIRKRYADTGEA